MLTIWRKENIVQKHKWYNEIVAWASGAEIESSDIYIDRQIWKEVSIPCWDNDRYLFRIKPTPKEPQYLYAWLNKDDDTVALEAFHPNGILEDKLFKYIGKIPLITENDNGND